MVKEEDPLNKKKSRVSIVLLVFRYISVIIVTLYLIGLFITTLDTTDLWTGIIIVATIAISIVMPFITLPIVGFWIYSFAESLKGRKKIFSGTKNNNILLLLQIFDIILVLAVIIMYNRPAFSCNAKIMETQYEKNWKEMHKIIKETRDLLPDSSSIFLEFKEGYMSDGSRSKSDLLDAMQLKKLEEDLDNVGCVGIRVDNYGKNGYGKLLFRRKDLGLYSYRLYYETLPKEKQDSLNTDYRFIVYNDSVVFEYGGGAFGSQDFPGKKEYMEKKNKRTVQK